MESLGIDSVNLGLPGAGPRAKADVLRLAQEIVSSKMRLRANCAARTVKSDIEPIADIVQATGLDIEAATFLGSSPIRQYAENWTLDFLQETTERAVTFARGLGLRVMYVTEDTTRSRPAAIQSCTPRPSNLGPAPLWFATRWATSRRAAFVPCCILFSRMS